MINFDFGLNSPRATVKKLFDESTSLSVHLQTDLPIFFKYTKFIESYECRFKKTPEKYPLSFLINKSMPTLPGPEKPNSVCLIILISNILAQLKFKPKKNLL